MILDPVKLIQRCCVTHRIALIGLFVAILPILIPLCEGRAWNGLGPFPFGPVYPPDNYSGPRPGSQITAESWGAASVVVPFQVQVKNYLTKGDLPLWNPYQGLGQPFAAQGEGCPYFPVTIIRALLPYTWSGYITLAFGYAAGFALYLFLRTMGLATASASFGAIAFTFSGAFYTQLARFNIADQICMIPLLFWSAGLALKSPSSRSLAVLTLISFLHMLGGFIQIAMLSALVCVGFALFYSAVLSRNLPGMFCRTGPFLAYFILGNGLASFFLLPLLEAMQGTFNKNGDLLALLPIPYANLVGFLFPGIFGPFFQNWIPGNWPDVISWDNLFGFSGCLLTLLLIIGIFMRGGWEKPNRALFLFFASATILLLLRYISFPPVAILNFLPVLGRQSPKHANGVTVFCIVVAASFVVDRLRLGGVTKRVIHTTCALVGLTLLSTLATLVYRQGGLEKIDKRLAINGILTTGIFIVAGWSAIVLSKGRGYPINLLLGFSALIFAENLVYIPLGSPSLAFSYMRLGLGLVLVFAAYGFLLNYRRVAWLGVVVATFVYALIVVPQSSLPENIDLTQPPTAMQWLARHTGNLYRSFGVHPDFCSVSKIRDLSALGPLSPKSYASFIKDVTDENTIGSFTGSCVFMLEGYYWRYPLGLYLKHKDLFDSAGVKYLFLDKAYFGPGLRNDDSVLASPAAHLSIAYQDSRVRIWRSDEAKSRFRLTSDFSFKEALSGTHPPIDNVDVQTPFDGGKTSGKLEVIEARPNSLKIEATTDVPQLLVTTDCYDPGWRVRIDGKWASLLRANGSFMGTIISSAGRHAIEFRYLPQSFVQGVLISSICILAMAGLLLPQMRLSLSNLEMIRRLNDFRLGNYNGVFLALFLVAIADIASAYGIFCCYFIH